MSSLDEMPINYTVPTLVKQLCTFVPVQIMTKITLQRTICIYGRSIILLSSRKLLIMCPIRVVGPVYLGGDSIEVVK